ncbi:MAG: hypothetical protein P8174_06920, partial [Gemmatimonadota bacterium]
MRVIHEGGHALTVRRRRHPQPHASLSIGAFETTTSLYMLRIWDRALTPMRCGERSKRSSFLREARDAPEIGRVARRLGTNAPVDEVIDQLALG